MMLSPLSTQHNRNGNMKAYSMGDDLTMSLVAMDRYSLGLRLQIDDPFVVQQDSDMAPSSTTSASSASSSFDQPYTPISGPTTPKHFVVVGYSSPSRESSHHSGSFAQAYAPISFELTPPQSAVTGYFPTGEQYPYPDHASFPQTHFINGLPTPSAPVTPSRRNSTDVDFGMLQMGIASPLRELTMEDLNTRGDLDARFWNHNIPSTGLSVSPFELDVQMPHSSFSSDVGIWDSGSMAHSMAMDGTSSDYMFNQGSTQPSSPFHTGTNNTVMSQAMQRKTTMLQAGRKPGRKIARRKNLERARGLVSVVGPRRNPCPHAGCRKSYKRPEHLIRHIASAHEERNVQCEFCSQTFNRDDNCLAHMALHAKRRTARARVEYYPMAQARLDEIRASQKGSRRGKQHERSASVSSMSSMTSSP